MVNDTMSLDEGLQFAIQTEVNGYHFYMMAAQATQDVKGREVFSQLADDELEHIRFLRKQFAHVKSTGHADGSLHLPSRSAYDGPSPIFSPALRDRLGEAHYEMSALAIGIQLELSSNQFYATQSEQADDPAAKQFYRELAEWEDGHYRALLAQQTDLKEDYWSQGGFSPF